MTCDHVAVSIVRIRVAIRERGQCMFVIRIVRRVVDSRLAGEIPSACIVSVGFGGIPALPVAPARVVWRRTDSLPTRREYSVGKVREVIHTGDLMGCEQRIVSATQQNHIDCPQSYRINR